MINYNRLGYEIKRDSTNFSIKISQKLKRPQQKFVHQIVYCILTENKLHLSKSARSLKENITLKKTIDQLSRNLNAFDEKQTVMQDYLSLVKQHTPEDCAVIAIDNSVIANPASRKLEALFQIRDGSTGEITQGYLTIEVAVLSESGKMPLPVYKKVFSAAEEGFVCETYENLCFLLSLSENFSPKCVRTLDRGFDTNDYNRYFLIRGGHFVICAKKNRNVIYNGKTCNIMDVALKHKGAYRMDFKDKSGKNVQCKMSCIPVRLCEFQTKSWC